jgi:hypothetical protein
MFYLLAASLLGTAALFVWQLRRRGNATNLGWMGAQWLAQHRAAHFS